MTTLTREKQNAAVPITVDADLNGGVLDASRRVAVQIARLLLKTVRVRMFKAPFTPSATSTTRTIKF